MAKQHPQWRFERYADDAIVPCRTEQQAQEVRAAIAVRWKDCGLELHPEKTKVVYCKDEDRRGTYGSEKFDLRSDKRIEDLSRMFNPIIRGWLQYYGRFYRSALYPPMRQLDRSLARWADRKYKKLRRHLRRATHWVARISRRDPKLWAHWQMGVRRGSMAGAV